MKLAVLIFLSALVVGVICYDNTTVGDLPPGVAAQLLSLLTNKTLDLTGGCDDPQETDIELLLYTRSNSNASITLNSTNLSAIDPTKKVILLVHGWISNPDRFFPETTDAYLQRYDCNVIIVNWSKLAKQLYTVSVCYVPKVAQIVANFLCQIDGEFGISPNTVHLVGHSLGGQMSGFIGQHVRTTCAAKIGRITAMDPAGPFFQGLPTDQRLDKSDADFVDVIHTNEGVLGYWGNCGNADFHVNCGTIQTGCPQFGLTLATIQDLPLSVVACNHMRSVDYMTESINSVNFEARSCGNCPLPCIPNLLKSESGIVMGEDCSTDTATGGYLLVTGITSPYALGSIKLIPAVPSLTNFFN